jgi:four helix bundle protein
MAFSSGAEVETQLMIAFEIGYLNKEEFQKLNNLLEEIMKMLNKLIQSLSL